MHWVERNKTMALKNFKNENNILSTSPGPTAYKGKYSLYFGYGNQNLKSNTHKYFKCKFTIEIDAKKLLTTDVKKKIYIDIDNDKDGNIIVTEIEESLFSTHYNIM